MWVAMADPIKSQNIKSMKNGLVIPEHYVYILNFTEVRKSRQTWNGIDK